LRSWAFERHGFLMSQISSLSWRWLAIVLLACVLLRIELVREGGQNFFWDEWRYNRGLNLYQALRTGDLPAARAVLSDPAHFAFTPVSAALVALQHLGAQATPWAEWGRAENILASRPLATGILAFCSVLNIALAYGIARRTTGDVATARWVALLMAGSNTGFYFARHFLPYDLALSSALAAILVGLGGRRSLRAGLLAGATYHLYNGYWYLLPVLFLLHGLDVTAASEGRLRRLVRFTGGAALALVIPVVIGVAVNGERFWRGIIGFSQTVNQGEYLEGWSLPWAYLWHSENAFGLVVVAALVVALMVARRRPHPSDRAAHLWLGALALGYGLLVLFSVGLEKFVVCGRMVKPFVPLACLVGGWAAVRLFQGRKATTKLAMITVGALAACNLAPHFFRTFPGEVETRLLRELGNPKRALSVRGSIYLRMSVPVTRPELVLVNFQMLFPVRDAADFPTGLTLLRLEHPLTYAPYQYEGHTPRERKFLREHDISMRLIRCDNPAAVPNEPGLLPPATVMAPY
jgi:hypothetical protein